MSDTLQPYDLQHARLPCISPTPGDCSNSCPLSQGCHPTISSSVVPFSSCLQSFPAFRVFSNASVLHIRWPKYWSFSFSISPLSEFIVTHWIPSNEYSGLISFRIDWFDLLAVQGTLKSLLQHHSSGKCWPPKMSLDSFPLLQFFGWIWERLVLLPLWYSSPVKPSDPELFFVGRFWL